LTYEKAEREKDLIEVEEEERRFQKEDEEIE